MRMDHYHYLVHQLNYTYISFLVMVVIQLMYNPMIGYFYQYLQDKNIVRTEDWYHSLYLAVHPSYYSAKSLPKHLKIEAAQKAKQWADLIRQGGHAEMYVTYSARGEYGSSEDVT